MHIHDLSGSSSVLSRFIAELRDTEIQQDRLRFRKNVVRIGSILGYELSKSLESETLTVTTPLGTSTSSVPVKDVVICSVLRAGLPLHQGLLEVFDDAENTFVSAYRKHRPEDPKKFEIVIEYLASPSLEGKALILADPMLASGKSMVNVFEALRAMGTPKEVHLVSVIGAEAGIVHVQKHFPSTSHLWVAAIDPCLNDHGYIVPGLGDAGDLSFGTKLQQ